MIRKLAAVCALALISSAALGHPAQEHLSGVAAGFAHPFMGVDHLLAMVALGIWAAQCKGPSMLLAPAVFILSMVAGAVFALNGGVVAFAEHGIAFSVLIIGLFVAMVPAQGIVRTLALALVALGATMHGFAHAVQAPTESAIQLILGFAIGTSMLHGFGLLLGCALRDRIVAMRATGFAITTAGSVMLWTLG